MEPRVNIAAETLVNKPRSEISAHRFFLCVAPAMCLLMVWLTPPFQAADEYAHYFRIHQIAEGQWYGEKFDDRVGGFIPVSILKTTEAFDNMPRNPRQKLQWSLWRQTWSVPLCPEHRVARDFAGAGCMPSYAYLPQAAGMRIGTLFNSPPILLFYLARLANAFAWCLLVYLAVRLIPTASWLLTALALAPMSIFQAGSLSYDASINGLAFLFLALILRRAFAVDYSLNWKDLFIWMLIVVAIAASKLFYAALALLIFIVLPKLPGKRSHYVKTALFLAIVTAICFGLWTMAKSNYLTYDEYNPAFRDTQPFVPGSSPFLQARYLLNHPGAFLRAAATTMFTSDQYITWIGKLGWLDTPFPNWFYIGFGLLVLSIVAADRVPGVRILMLQRIFLVAIAALAAVSVLVSLYLFFTPVGADIIQGVQGRYFISIVPLVLIAFHGKLARIPSAWCCRFVPILLIMVQVITITIILRRYYF
ncbi:MAG: DUF2142 domain-containing protein [Kiritimatiellae bacterium]|nr:DUF2142 domain-containing protein [Kiritimatiellia bacterium]